MSSRFMFDLRTLDIFSHVVKAGNMSVAAAQLNMTQSSVSQSISNLEETLKTPLLDRTVRPLTVTSAGRFLFDRSQKLLHEAQQTTHALEKSDYTQLGHINIALVDSIATAVGSSLVNAVKKRTQDWSINTGLSHLHGHALLSRQCDLIISDDALEDTPDLCRYDIIREPFILALPNDYTEQVSDLNALQKKLDFIRYNGNTLIGRSIERYLRRCHVEPVERLQLDNSYAIVSAVSNGLGWTITTPLCLFQTGIRLHQVQIRRLPKESFERSITLVSRKNELGDLPREIAKDSIGILERDFLSEMAEEQPWLLEHISLGS